MGIILKILAWPKSLLYLLIPHLAKEMIFLREHTIILIFIFIFILKNWKIILMKIGRLFEF
jgi:hypothetical protein